MAIQLAAWFHDVIYNPKATDNEAKSADYASIILKTGKISFKTIKKVQNLILITKHHQLERNDIDSQIFLDADLAILGTSSSEYQAYAKAIRREYAWVSEPEYCLKRKQVLEKFLNQNRIYLTEPMFEKLEQQARKNIQREISKLRL